MLIEPQTPVSFLDHYISHIGWVSFLTMFGTALWRLRGKIDSFILSVKASDQLIAETKAVVDKISTNHLSHIQDDTQYLKRNFDDFESHQTKGFEMLAAKHDKSNELLGEIKTVLAVVADRLPRE